jgi:hypothetical protein
MTSTQQEKIKQLLWFTGGALCGLAMLSISKASVAPSQVTDDTAIYQNLSEIQVTKERAPNFDGDISKLSQMENRYQDKLPNGQTRIAARSQAARRPKVPKQFSDLPPVR